MSTKALTKTIFNSHQNSAMMDLSLLILRIGTGLFMLFGHGLKKIPALDQDPVVFMNFMGLGTELSLYMAIITEIGCSILILVGLGTRLAILPLMATMAVAAFVYHSADPFAVKEMALLYFMAFTVIFLQGAGKFSLDHLIGKK